jgi:hypothetical protein
MQVSSTQSEDKRGAEALGKADPDLALFVSDCYLTICNAVALHRSFHAFQIHALRTFF